MSNLDEIVEELVKSIKELADGYHLEIDRGQNAANAAAGFANDVARLEEENKRLQSELTAAVLRLRECARMFAEIGAWADSNQADAWADMVRNGIEGKDK